MVRLVYVFRCICEWITSYIPSIWKFRRDPFHFICEDAPEIGKKTTSEDTSDGGKANQDAALAMGKGAAMKELMSLPLAELERRCRHNGLSLVGGGEIMVARLLSLENTEKQRGYELDDDLKFTQRHLSSGRYSSGRKEVNAEAEPAGLSGWNHYGEDGKQSLGVGSAPLTSTLSIPQLELKAFTKKEKNDPVLPASKWAWEDDESDDEQKRSSRGLGLGYSSSGSENAGDGHSKADDIDFATDASIPVQSNSGMNEEQRQNLRRLEVALIEYRESLEEWGIKSSEEIDRSGSPSQATSLNMTFRVKMKMFQGTREHFRRGGTDGMISVTLQENDTAARAKVRAHLHENHRTGTGKMI